MDKMQPEGQKVKGPLKDQGDRAQVIQVFFVLKKGFIFQIYLASIDQASHKRDLHWNFVKGTKWIKDQKKRV